MWQRFLQWWRGMPSLSDEQHADPSPVSDAQREVPPLVPTERWPFGGHHLVVSEQIRDHILQWRCTICQETWDYGHPRTLCPRVPYYPEMSHPATYATLVALWSQGQQPVAGSCGRRFILPDDESEQIRSQHIWLYDTRQTIPHRTLTPRQQALARKRAYADERLAQEETWPPTGRRYWRCISCGKPLAAYWQRCTACDVSYEEIHLLRAYERTQQWAQELLEHGDFRILSIATTGRLRWHDRICAITVMESDGQVAYETLVHPGKAIKPDAMAAHGLRDADVVDAPRLSDIAPTLLSWLCDRPILVFPRAFVQPLLEQEAKRQQIALPAITWVCI